MAIWTTCVLGLVCEKNNMATVALREKWKVKMKEEIHSIPAMELNAELFIIVIVAQWNLLIICNTVEYDYTKIDAVLQHS